MFPSWTDTFGQVMVEAMASGLPVAAFPVTGPIDVVASEDVGMVNEDLHAACLSALKNKSAEKCIAYAKTFSWASMTRTFLQSHRKVYGTSGKHAQEEEAGARRPVGLRLR